MDGKTTGIVLSVTSYYTGRRPNTTTQRFFKIFLKFELFWGLRASPLKYIALQLRKDSLHFPISLQGRKDSLHFPIAETTWEQGVLLMGDRLGTWGAVDVLAW